MTTSATPMILSKKTQEGLIAFQHQCFQMMNNQWNIREQMRNVDLLYMRENDLTLENQRAKLYNRYGDSDRLQNLTIPVVMPQVESAVTYQSSVFLTGVPLFGVVSGPEFEDEAVQMETVIDDSAVRGGWTKEFMLTFRDGFKYNLGFIEVTWDRRVTASLETDITFGGGKQAKPKEVIWEGNCLRRLDPYNTFYDTRVSPTEIHTKGEFAGYNELMGRTQLKSFINEMPDKMVDNVKEAFESGYMGGTTGFSGGIESYFTPQLNPNALTNTSLTATTNWAAWAGIAGSTKNIQYKDMYEVTTLYARIIPADFAMKVPSPNTPQIWKFIIINHQILIYAERQTNAHNYLPILTCQPLEDGLRYQTKSLANNVRPMQEISSSLMNSVMAARRRSATDRGLYDPSRVNKSDINSANPSAKIPVRPSAYGKDLSQAYFPIPFRDDQSSLILQEIGVINNYANTISGQNPVKQGQFVKGNKTQKEFSDVMANANGRDQMTSMLLEAQLFTPLKEILKTNVIQYQGGGVSVYNRALSQQVPIDPIALRKAVMEFKVSDGLTPTDKLINADTLQVAMQVMGSSPQIAAGYNIAPLFSYLMKTQGAHLKEFEKSPPQIAYEQAQAQYQQMVMQLYKQNPDQDPAKLPPAPTPAQFGYTPAGLGVQSSSPPQSQGPASAFPAQAPASQPPATQ
jgi:hypothetical protein